MRTNAPDPRRFSLGLWLVLGAVPFAMGARGCIDELTVGLERNAVVDPDGGTPGPCEPSDCQEAPPSPRRCADAQEVRPVCERTSAACTWTLAPCDVDAGSAPPCAPEDCEDPVIWLAAAPGSCADGSEPSCTRDERGLCTLACAPKVACNPRVGADCPEGMFCAFALGSCGQSDEHGVCRTREASCPESDTEVCACDGRTYGSACLAFQAGISVAYVGPCGVVPERCDPSACNGPTPVASEAACADGIHTSGPLCQERSDGSCAYVWRECPVQGACTFDARASVDSGACWTSLDCPDGKTCLGASLCPCDTLCFAPDQPGQCR